MPEQLLASADQAEVSSDLDDDLISQVEACSLSRPGRLIREEDIKTTSTYAAKAAPKRSRSDYPYLLYFHRQGEIRLPLPEEDFNALRAEVQNRSMRCLAEGTPIKLSLAWSAYLKDKGIIACRDKFTQDWFLNIVQEFTPPSGEPIRAWKKGESGSLRVATIPVPMNWAAVSSATLIHGITATGDITGSCTLVEDKPWPAGGHGARIMVVHIDREFDRSYRARGPNNAPSFGCDSFPFYYRPFPREDVPSSPSGETN